MYLRFLTAFLITGVLFSTPLAATPYFDNCQDMTGSNATFILPEEVLETSALSVSTGSEIALFTPDGLCAGYAVWEGEALAVPLWEDNPLTAPQDGFVPGEPLRLAVWDASSETEYPDVPLNLAPVYNADFVFSPDAVYLVDLLGATTDTTDGGTQPIAFSLEANYPNPFVDATTIGYAVAEPTTVRLDVYNLLGQHVAELVNEPQEPGDYEITYRPDTALASGTYLYRIATDTYAEVHRMTIVR